MSDQTRHDAATLEWQHTSNSQGGVTMKNLDLLINELRKLPNETQWVEFKHNNYDPEMIG